MHHPQRLGIPRTAALGCVSQREVPAKRYGSNSVPDWQNGDVFRPGLDHADFGGGGTGAGGKCLTTCSGTGPRLVARVGERGRQTGGAG